MNKSYSTSIAALALVSASALAFASPAAAAAPTGQKYQFKGENASASFSSLDASGCIATDVYLWAGENVTKEGPGAPAASTEVYASVSKVDICDGWRVLFSASGATSSAELDIDRTAGASLEATIPLFDYVSETWIDLTLDLTWRGVGEISRGHSNSHDRFPGGMSRYRSTGSYRQAEVSGSIRVSLEPGRELAVSPVFAQLSASSSGSFFAGPVFPIPIDR